MTAAAFAKTLSVFVDSLGKASQAQVAREAARVVAETRTQSPVPPAYRINIGGKASQLFDGPLPPISVGERDAVTLYFDHRREVVAGAIWWLKAASPRVTGDYEAAFRVFVDGEEISDGLVQAFPKIIPGARVEVINIAPYARMLEIGKRPDGSPFVLQTPPGIVERAGAKLAAKEFRRLADLFFTYRDVKSNEPDVPWIIRGAMIGTIYTNAIGKRVKRRAFADRSAGQPVRYPTIVVGERRYAGV
jgi:hypothetical protein